jgi:hypothetical protein
MAIDHLSLSTTILFLNKGDETLSQGTGFFYHRKEEGYNITCLVTNYHVLIGYNPMTKNSPKGDNITFQFHLSDQEPGPVRTIKYPLFTIHQKPVWLTSSVCPEADLAVIPLPMPLIEEFNVYVISMENERLYDALLVRPAMPITLIGYPHGRYDTKNSLPIWKTGSIASEPAVDFEGKPQFMVDVSVFPGMSGSPAFAVSSTWETEKGRILGDGSIRKFMGILSSGWIESERKYLEEIMVKPRLGIIDQKSLEIAVIWKANLISQLIYSSDLRKYWEDISSKVRWRVLNS